MYKCYHVLQKSYLFKCATTEASLRAKRNNIKLPKGGNPVQLQDTICTRFRPSSDNQDCNAPTAKYCQQQFKLYQENTNKQY